MIKVALVEDQQLVREGIAGLLFLSGKVQILWQAANGAEALEKIQTTSVDILLADISMPIMDGITLVQKLREEGLITPVMMLTTFDDAELFSKSLKAGANGFLLKDVSLEKLIHSIESLVTGNFLTDSALLQKWQQQSVETSLTPVYLTEREMQIMRLLVGGCSNKEIVRALFLAEGTVRNHVSNILAKLECRDRMQAVVKAIELGLV